MNALTRRAWLRGVAGCSIGLALPAVRAAQPVPALPFGFSQYGMKNLKLADAIKACAEIGYDGMELALMPGYPSEPKLLSADERRDLAKRLVDAGQALLSLMENLQGAADDDQHRTNLERLKEAAELGHALSPKAPPVIETILRGRPAEWEQGKARMAERMADWAKVGAAAKTIIAVKPHVSNALHTPEAALWLHKQVNSPWLKLAYDYSHYKVRGLTLEKSLAAILPACAFIHVKDSRGTADKFEFLLPGDGGDIDYVQYFKQLHAAAYRGPVVVEVSTQVFSRADYDPLAAARRSYNNLAPALNRRKV